MELKAYIGKVTTEPIVKDDRDFKGNIVISSYGIILNKVILSGTFKPEEMTKILEKLRNNTIEIVI